MPTEFAMKFTGIMTNFFTRMVQGLENLTINGIKVKEGIILLNYIQSQQQVTMSEIKDFLDTNPSTATRRVDTLAKNGLVERKSDDTDRRIWYINTTDKGREVHKAFFEDRMKMLGKFMEQISEEEILTFLNVIEKYLAFVDREVEPIHTIR